MQNVLWRLMRQYLNYNLAKHTNKSTPKKWIKSRHSKDTSITFVTQVDDLIRALVNLIIPRLIVQCQYLWTHHEKKEILFIVGPLRSISPPFMWKFYLSLSYSTTVRTRVKTVLFLTRWHANNEFLFCLRFARCVRV